MTYRLVDQKDVMFTELDEQGKIVKEYVAKVVYHESVRDLAMYIMKVKWNKKSPYAITST